MCFAAVDEDYPYDEEVNTLYSYFNINKEDNNNWLTANEPEDRHVGLALIAYAQQNRGPNQFHQTTVSEARKVLSESDPKDFKLGNLWLLLADYKRLFLRKDILHGWKEQNTGDRFALEARFLHTTVDSLRLSDLPELLLDYKTLLNGTV